MRTGHVTTPFGRRPMTLALVKGQLSAAQTQSTTVVEKWKVFRDVCEARELLGLQDRAIAVLNALLTFYPDNVLDQQQGLVVFPSNDQITLRAHGIAGTTLRRQLTALVEAGLLQRRDSPNGKRYAHRNRDGDIEKAFGFDLSPLLARACELAAMAQDVAAEKMRFRRAKEALTICRRDVRKLISAAMDEGAAGNWMVVEETYVTIIARLKRKTSRVEVEAVLEEMEMLRDEVVNILENQLKTDETDGNASQNGYHIQNSKPESINESEPSSGKEQGVKSASLPQTPDQTQPRAGKLNERIKAFPLGMVLRACPQISDYGSAGGICSWRDMMAAAVVARSALAISPSAYEDACATMGPENAAVAVAYILERSNFINSPGGYLRDLTKRSERGEFSLGSMLMSLLRSHGMEVMKVG
ncbi:plasmid replication protein RepC [Rhizobium panacihumi]|uniref:plasmid replication protein RepC n=1 Tax=Rhizobium panacihumi TaxID=2008450 RepID=UPI003D79A08B